MVWFGDSNGHDPSGGITLAQAIAALQTAHIEVIAIPVTTPSGNGLDSTGQASAIASATGGQVLPSATPDQVSNAILSGLSNLPVTVTPVPTCDTGLSATYDAPSKTVTSGMDLTFNETLTVATDAPEGGTLHCTVDFLLNGNHQDGFQQTVNIDVPDPPITATGGFSFTGTEPAAVSGTVATFTDPDTFATAGEYSASIDWGDGGPPTSGTITGGNGSFSVDGTHTYSEEGSYAITVTITDIDNAANSAAVTDAASVADAPLTANCANVPNSLQSFNGTVANLIDANPIGTLSDFSATIDWGDSSSSAGTLSGSGPFTVSGSHTYSTTGFFTITTSIKDVGGSTATTACKVLVFAFAPGGGSFVIGDNNSGNGTSVTFWGAQWWKLNSLTGGAAPASFKGFALNPPTPSCGDRLEHRPWQQRPAAGRASAGLHGRDRVELDLQVGPTDLR